MEINTEESTSPSVLQEWSRREEKTRQRRTMGRSARRRRAKLKAIQEAEKRLWTEGQEVVPRAVPVPQDRSQVQLGVLERRKECWMEADEAALVGQLGFVPGNAVAVVARAERFPSLPIEENVPIVLKLYPLALRDTHMGGKKDGRRFKGRRRGKLAVNDESLSTNDSTDASTADALVEPFPTIYWLTHPLLRTLTSKLELEKTDNVKVTEDRLSSDQDAIVSMARAHSAYGEDRWETLTSEDVEWVTKRKWRPALDARRGVAGIKKNGTVKCLHTHLAHYLSGGPGSEQNIVGRWVFEAILKLIKCQDKGCSSSWPAEDGKVS